MKKIMKWAGSFFVLLLFTLPALAQKETDQNRMQQIEAVKIAFITQKLNLTTQEAEKFWPVYNVYQKALTNLIMQKKQARTANNTDADTKLNNELDFDDQILELRKKYKIEFSKVIPTQKVLQLYQAEHEFREQLIKQLKERHRD